MPELPRAKRPICVVGAGGIVRDAHLPAYALAGFRVAGITDVDATRAQKTASEFGVEHAYDSLAAMVSAAPKDVVYDIAVPASAIPGVLRQLPDRSAVLIQKPLGEDLSQARAIRDLCRSKSLTAAVNFQLRWAPYIARARELIASGAIGTLHDIEVRVTVFMPWQLWTFLEAAPRVEIVYHSVHYIDLIRSFAGEPTRVHALTLRHPIAPKLHSTRTTIAMDYGQAVRATITTNHGHQFGLDEQESYVKWEGTKGAIKARLGLLMNYPHGEPDQLRMCQLDEANKPQGWRDVPFTGSWYPHAFIGSMASLQRFDEGTSSVLPTSVDDAFKTMAVVEACYRDSEHGGAEIPT